MEVRKILDIVKVNEEEDRQYIKKLKRTSDKVLYLRFIKKYTQEEVAAMIGISSRHVRRIEKNIKTQELGIF